MALRLLLLSLLPGFIYPFGLPTPLTLVNKVPFMRQFTTEIQIDLPSIDASGVYDPSAKEVVEAASALPNPIVPVIFTLFLVGGVGALTGSLGDVVAEEASTGDRAGMKARKESERRSTRFLDTRGQRR